MTGAASRDEGPRGGSGDPRDGGGDDRVDVAQVVVTERWARDTAQWGVMAGCFHPDARVEISWISTDGPTFVSLSREGFEAGARSAHVVGAPVVRVRGDRAVADAGVTITGPLTLDGVEVVLTASCRLLERLEKRDGLWRISAMTCVYEFDHFSRDVPGFDSSAHRASYAALSHWVARTRGEAAVREDLPGVDRPEEMAQVYAAATAWLAGANRDDIRAHDEGAN